MGWKNTFFLFLIPQFLPACTCLVSRSTCQEVADSNLVFIGTVEGIVHRIRSDAGETASGHDLDRESGDESSI
jgi:hypothetical protein